MDKQLAAWRNLDGTYTLRTKAVLDRLEKWDRMWSQVAEVSPATIQLENLPDRQPRSNAESFREKLRQLGGRDDAGSGDWIVPESVVDELGAYRVFVVIVSNECCGSATPAEVRARDLERGKVFRVFCPRCGKRPAGSTLWEVPIVEFCGEGEEGQRTYETAFQAEIDDLR